MAIYYWHNQGRTGNLLFQYAAIVNLIEPRDKVFCFESEIFDLIETDNRFFRVPLAAGGRLNVLVNRFFDLMVKAKFFSEISPKLMPLGDEYTSEDLLVAKRRGLFSWVGQIKGFFQNDRWVFSALRFKAARVFSASEKLNKVCASNVRVAVHLRLSDYKDWVVLGRKDVSLGVAWYRDAMKIVESKVENPTFIFFTDDKEEAASLDICRDAVFFTGEDALEELVAMSLCDHAIISPSTFAYCAVMANYSMAKIIVAPKYWAGFKSCLWYPYNIKTDRFLYTEVG